MPHTVGSVCGCKRGLSQLRFAWSTKRGLMRNVIPAPDQDVSAYQAVSFRISQSISALQPDLNATVLLRDTAGVTSKVAVQSWSDAMFRPLGTTGGYTPKLILNTVRIPLSAFKGVDLTKIATVTLRFNKAKAGSVLMTDLAFND